MCMQCMASAMAAMGTASGARAYVGGRRCAWLTPPRLRALTIVLVIGALAASALLVSGSAPSAGQTGHARPAAAAPR